MRLYNSHRTRLPHHFVFGSQKARLALAILSVLLPLVSEASEGRFSVYFWNSPIMREETVLMVRKEGLVSGRLLFRPIEILKIEDYFTKREWKPAEVVTAAGTSLILRDGAPLPFIEERELFPPKPEKKPAFATKDGRPIIAGDGTSFVKNQIRVTYRHRPNEWAERGGAVPECQGDRLPRTLQLLKEHRPLKMVVFGDSISAGANASGVPVRKSPSEYWPGTPYPPCRKAYPGRLVDSLHELFGSEITLVNCSLGGMATPGALKVVSDVSAKKADLVILGFGMNDTCYANVPVAEYERNTESLITKIRAARPETEFVLLATMPPNKEWEHAHEYYQAYLPRLKAIATRVPGVAVADLTSVFDEILKYKPYADFSTGLLHPNDFGHDIYSEVLLQTFVVPPK